VSSLSQEYSRSYVFIPMDTDLEQKTIISIDGDESLRVTSELGVDTSAENLPSKMESFLRDYIINVTCLLENILHYKNTWMFVEKKGVNSMLQLFDLPLLPFSFAGGHNIVVSFKKIFTIALMSSHKRCSYYF